MNPRTRRSRKRRKVMRAEYAAFNSLCTRFHWLKNGARIHVVFFTLVKKYRSIGLKHPIKEAREYIEDKVVRELSGTSRW